MSSIAALGIGWLLVLLLLHVGGSDAADTPQGRARPEDVIAQLFAAAVMIGPAVIAMRRRRESPATAGVTRKNLGRSLALSVPLVAAIVVWRLASSRWVGTDTGYDVTDFWALGQFVVVGFAEEYAYRGYLQTRMIDWLGRYRGWILTSVVMAMAHVGHRMTVSRMAFGEALTSSASLIPVSLFLGYVMMRTRNIIAPGIVHSVIDWLDL